MRYRRLCCREVFRLASLAFVLLATVFMFGCIPCWWLLKKLIPSLCLYHVCLAVAGPALLLVGHDVFECARRLRERAEGAVPASPPKTGEKHDADSGEL